MNLLVLPPVALQQIERAIVEATHMATDATGEKLTLSTIDGPTLEMAARVAIEIATRMPVWPAGQQLRIKPPRRQTGILDIQE